MRHQTQNHLIRCVLSVASILIGVIVQDTYAAIPSVLVGPDLAPIPVGIQSMRSGVLTYFDTDRALQTRSIDSVLQLKQINGTVPREELDEQGSWLMLVDGQRVFGKWLKSKHEEQIVWEHRQLGRLEIHIDQVSTISVSVSGTHEDLEIKRGSDQDHIVLTNGDTLSGYLLGLGRGEVSLQLAGHDDVVRVPSMQVRHLSINNSPMDKPEHSYQVWLADGTRICARLVEMAKGKIDLESDLFATDRTVSLPIRHIAQVDLPVGTERLLPLSAMQVQVLDESDVFGLKVSPKVDSRSIYLHAPVAVKILLPTGSLRFASTLRLEHGSQGVWADVWVIIRNSTNMIEKIHLHSNNVEARVNIPLDGQELIVELDEASNGPIQDGVNFVDPMIYRVEPVGLENNEIESNRPLN